MLGLELAEFHFLSSHQFLIHFAFSWPGNSLLYGFLLDKETSGAFLILERSIVTFKPFLIKPSRSLE